MLAGQSKNTNGETSRFFADMDVLQDSPDLVLDDFPAFGLVSRVSAEDNPGFGEAKNGPNSEGFWESSAKEISTLQNLKSLDMVKRKSWMNVIQTDL